MKTPAHRPAIRKDFFSVHVSGVGELVGGVLILSTLAAFAEAYFHSAYSSIPNIRLAPSGISPAIV